MKNSFLTPEQNKTTSPAMLALSGALLFGASTPASKMVLGQISPQLMAGLLYLGSGFGLTVYHCLSSKYFQLNQTQHPLKPSDFAWLVGTIIFGGITAPLLFMSGLKGASAASCSLLLNFESVFTALLAWVAFREHTDRRIVLGMLAIVCGGFVLAWTPAASLFLSTSSFAILGTCVCWAVDNNFMRNISDCDAVQIAAVKGLVAGSVNFALALSRGDTLPSIPSFMAASIIGFFGYGLSLVLFIKASSQLGTARTGAYFSTAPFAGSALSLLFFHEPIAFNFGIAAVLMAIGVYLHLTETHEHEHFHEPEEHEHWHIHDEHHQHNHDFPVKSLESHKHRHSHEAIMHSHSHYPDTQHRHVH